MIIVFPAYAKQIKQEKAIPRIDQLSLPYLSTILLLSPCLDISLLGFPNSDNDDETIRMVDERKERNIQLILAIILH